MCTRTGRRMLGIELAPNMDAAETLLIFPRIVVTLLRYRAPRSEMRARWERDVLLLEVPPMQALNSRLGRSATRRLRIPRERHLRLPSNCCLPNPRGKALIANRRACCARIAPWGTRRLWSRYPRKAGELGSEFFKLFLSLKSFFFVARRDL